MTTEQLQNLLERAANKIEDQKAQLLHAEFRQSLMEKVDMVKGEPGVKGDKGDAGKDGKDGKDGRDGKDGIIGRDGIDGKDGADGKHGKDGRNGLEGKQGKPGKDGKDGDEISPRQIVDHLESLKGDKRLDASAIKNLVKYMGQRSGVVSQGGGFSMQAVVDFITSQGFFPTSKLVYNEVVSGSGTSFQLAAKPITGLQSIYALGQKLKPGSGNDYTIDSNGKITTSLTWSSGDIMADYTKQ